MTEETTPAAPQAAETPAAPAAPETPAPPVETGPAANDYFGRAMAALSGQQETPPAAVAQPDAPGDHHVAQTLETEPATEGGEESTPVVEGVQPEPPQPNLTPEQYQEWLQQSQGFAQERAVFDARVQALQPNLDALKRAREASGVDAVVALRELGLDYRELTKRILANPDQPPLAPQPGAPDLSPIQDDVKALQDELKQWKYQETQRQASVGVAKQITETEGDRWQMLKASPDYSRQVVDYIQGDWTQKGSPVDANGQPMGALTIEQAADNLERYLFAQATKYSDLSKVRAHFGPAQTSTETPPALAPPAIPGAPPPSATVPEAATITTSHAAVAARGDNPRTAEEYRARALAVLARQE